MERLGLGNGEALQPHVVLDGDGEALLAAKRFIHGPGRTSYETMFLALRIPNGNPLTGRLFVPKADLSGMVALKFKVDAASAKPDSKQEFLKQSRTTIAACANGVSRAAPGSAIRRPKPPKPAAQTCPWKRRPSFQPTSTPVLGGRL